MQMSNIMTIKQAADELGVSTKTLRRWEENKYFIPEREQGTSIRLYDPYVIGYWKKLFELQRTIKNHLKQLNELKSNLDKNGLEQDYQVGKALKLFDEESMKPFMKASEDMEHWGEEYKRLVNEMRQYPKDMLRATAIVNEGDIK